MKEKLKGKGPATAVILSLTALAISLGGTSVAQVATTALSGKDKRDVRKIARGMANRRVRALSPQLPSSRANTAGFASRAGTATSASNAANASNVAGLSVRKFQAKIDVDETMDLASLVGFDLRLECTQEGSSTQAIMWARATSGGEMTHQPGAVDGVAPDAQTFGVFDDVFTGFSFTSDGGRRDRIDTFAFQSPDGSVVVTGWYALSPIHMGPATGTCAVKGGMLGG